ncbi:SPW repeat protein [Streptomyces sp. NPDC003758]
MSYPWRSTEIGDPSAPPQMRTDPKRAVTRGRAAVIHGLILLTGIFAAVSPWVVHFFRTNPYLTPVNLIVGLTTAAIGIGLPLAPERRHRLSWTLAPIGIWLIVSPSFVTAAHAVSPGIVWSNTVAGGMTCLLGLIASNML